ncbi:hypothetical protein JCM8097_005486 [Rhodosporidiobolus ruineniae]
MASTSRAAASASQGLSKRSAGVRRLLQEAAELSSDKDASYYAGPLEDDLFQWHFTIRGPGGDYDGGVYHGKMVLPSEYPFKPPEVYMLTPSGRFEVNKKICLSISSFHPETWQPSWGIRTALVALMAFFETEPKGAVGSLDAPPAERKRLARVSNTFKCSTCGYDAADSESFAALPPPPPASVVETKVKGTGEGAMGAEDGQSAEEAKVGISLAVTGLDDVVASEVPTPSISPAPPESDDGEGEADDPVEVVDPASALATTAATIFPATAGPARGGAASPTTGVAPPSARGGPLRHRAAAPSPSRGPASSGPPSSRSLPAHSHHHHHHPPSLAPPGAPRLSPAHLPPPSPGLAPPPNPVTNPLRAAPAVNPPAAPPAGQQGGAGAGALVLPPAAAAAEQLVLPPGLTLAQMMSTPAGQAGGPPQWVDRAILGVLLALLALVVRKVA